MTDFSHVYTDKREARVAFSRLRASIPDRDAYSEQLCRNILATNEYKSADTILLYFQTKSEPDLRLLASIAQKDQKDVAYPISKNESKTLDFRIVRDFSELRVGAYGILEPDDAAKKPILTGNTLCIVPALAIDRSGYRLGYGGGYYDRFLSTFEGNAIVAIHSSLLCDRLPRYDTDVPIKTIITQTGVLTTI